MELWKFATGEMLHIEYVRLLQRKGEHELVYHALKELLEQQPDNRYFEAEFLKAIVYYHPTESDELKVHADIVFKTKRKDVAELGYTAYYLSLNDIDQALEHYKNINDKSECLRDQIADVLDAYECGKEFRKIIYDRASLSEKIDKNIHCSGRFIFQTYDVAMDYYDNEDYENAVRYFKKSLKKRKEDYKDICFSKLGKCYRFLRKFMPFDYCYKRSLQILVNRMEKAKDESQLIKLRGHYFKTLYDYCIGLLSFSKYEEALEGSKILETGSNIDKDLAIYVKERVYKCQQNYDEAIKLCKILLTTGGKNPFFALADLVEIYTFIGDDKSAEKYLKQLYTDYPDTTPEFKLNYYFSFKYNDEGLAYAKRFLSTEHDTIARYYLGRFNNRLGFFKTARGYLKEIEKKCSFLYYYYELGKANAHTDNYAEAEENYKAYIEMCKKHYDGSSLSKGYSAIIDLYNSIRNWQKAEEYIEKYESLDIKRKEFVDYTRATHYFQKQDYNNAISYFEKLYDTVLENKAKSCLMTIYRYMGADFLSSSVNLMNELKGTEYSADAKLHEARLLKDQHTHESLTEALRLLSEIDDGRIKSTVILEKLQILIKLDQDKQALACLEEANEEEAILDADYNRYKAYLSIRKGLYDGNNKDQFIRLSHRYKESIAIDDILYKINSQYRSFYLSEDDVISIFYEFVTFVDDFGYKYYIDDLYDVYVFDMGKVIGTCNGIETQFIEIRCEQNTHNIHAIQPTQKRINVNSFGGRSRNRTDLVQN